MKINLVSLMLAILPATYIHLPAQGIKISSGASLVVNGSANLVLANTGITNNGQFFPGNGAVMFTGNSATSGSFINGSSTTGFYNLTLNKTSNGIQLGRDISISNILLFTSGDSLFLNSFNIDLGLTGTLSGEASTKRITGRTGGYIQSTQVLNAPAAVNPGNLGFQITSTANLGSTVIRRGHQQQSGASIYRYFTVTPTNNSGLAATIEFYYFDNELAGIAEPNLALFSSANGGVQWLNLGEDDINQGANILTLASIDILNRFTLANISAPLAVKLIRFYVVPAANEVTLHWLTSTESNNHYFAVERSADGMHFMEIGKVPGYGTSNQEQQYRFTDLWPLSDKSWYRLRQVDIDGKISYTPVLMINRNFNTIQPARLYPNPVPGTTIFLSLNSDKAGERTFMMYNQAGMLLKQFNVSLVTGTQLIELQTGLLPAGIYILRQQGNARFNLNFLKQ
ncbi:MAG TPA: T9SS type A sorting domain-containing protein [Chitinophagaceae bacterium]|nr:T9SS type A sorting domain-containing protein [Chitinophagaceae bacterium]HPH30675.1 T9SS type A sorting domain-containing protein [Chitinophagaceae bacterium]HPN58151.1 T9SS type A sorting domain-containing protein [Chitinophagaceae bacterium]